MDYNIFLFLNDACSVIGAFLILFAYYKISTDKWSNDSKKFYVINFLGAVFALLGIIYRFNMSVLIIEIVFGFLSIRGYMRVSKKDT